MAARAHMERYGTSSEDFGRLAILCRTNARRQRAGDDAHPDDDGRLHGEPVDLRAVPHARLLPRDRRCGGPRDRQRGPGEGHTAPSACSSRARRGAAGSASTATRPTWRISPAKPIAKRLFAPPASGRPTSTSPSSTTASPTPCSPRSRATASPMTAGFPTCCRDGAFDRGDRHPPGEHPRRAALGGLPPRVQPRLRGGRADQGRGRAPARSIATIGPWSPGSWRYISAYSGALVLAGA